MKNTTLTNDNIYALKVANRCDSGFKWNINRIIESGNLMDKILCYLKENPRSRCADIAKNVCNGEYSCQKVNAMLIKLCTSKFVKREEGAESYAIKIGADYDEKAILVTPVFFSLA